MRSNVREIGRQSADDPGYVRTDAWIAPRDEHQSALDERVAGQRQARRIAAGVQLECHREKLLLILRGEQPDGVRRIEQSPEALEHDEVAGVPVECLPHLLAR